MTLNGAGAAFASIDDAIKKVHALADTDTDNRQPTSPLGFSGHPEIT
ncbi:hypothetical protein [Catenuloplanes indicus]|uniref:Uncharacterized protein n=1 Tax=Catenuloplanes indicus TaxID=137267 RepID=A0AAE3W2P7_9ACTN|nr:hypothetical protein [Catenuloplanes indicus]MDQ0368187.1 hypothetical protein [Catenuloplanes indicus]